MRDSGARRFRYDFFGSLYTGLDAALDTAAIVEFVRRAGQFSIDERGEPGDLYDVESSCIGGQAARIDRSLSASAL